MDKSVHIELNKIEKVAKPLNEAGLFVINGVYSYITKVIDIRQPNAHIKT
jgi:hypothetical protein